MSDYKRMRRRTWLDRLLGINKQPPFEWTYYSSSLSWQEEEIDLRWRWRYSRLNLATWLRRARWAVRDLYWELRWRYNDWKAEEMWR